MLQCQTSMKIPKIPEQTVYRHSRPIPNPDWLKNLEDSLIVLPWSQGFQKGITCRVAMSKP